ncbi:MAG TPA: type VII secretion target [Actinomycetes bacterium]|nr:type VII secretion target [Actinomycetes bacterium]
MVATIAVAPPRLRQAAVAQRAVGARLLEVRGQLGATAAGLDPALGGPGARSAFAELWTRWCGSLQGLAGEVVTLAGALQAAAEAYERGDRRSVPGAGLGAGGGGADAAAR